MGIDIDALWVFPRPPRAVAAGGDDMASRGLAELSRTDPSVPAVWLGYAKNEDEEAIAEDVDAWLGEKTVPEHPPLLMFQVFEDLTIHTDVSRGFAASLIDPEPYQPPDAHGLDETPLPPGLSAHWIVVAGWYLPDALRRLPVALDAPRAVAATARRIAARDDRFVAFAQSGPIDVEPWACGLLGALQDSGIHAEVALTAIAGRDDQAWLLRFFGVDGRFRLHTTRLDWTPGPVGTATPAPPKPKAPPINVAALVQALDPGPTERADRPAFQKRVRTALREVLETESVGPRHRWPLEEATNTWLKALYRQYFEPNQRNAIIRNAGYDLVETVVKKPGGPALLNALRR